MTMMGETMTQWVTVAVQATLLLSVASVVAAAARRSSASVRHLVWSVALGGVLVLPLLASTGLRLAVPVPWLAPATQDAVAVTPPPAAHSAPAPGGWVPEPVPSQAAVGTPRATSPATTGRTLRRGAGSQHERAEATRSEAMRPFSVPADPADVPTASPSVRAEEPRSTISAATGTDLPTPFPWGDLFFAVWAIGACALLFRTALSQIAARRLFTGRSRPATRALFCRAQRLADESGVDRPIDLRLGRDVDVPLHWGFRTAHILLPESATRWPEARLDRALLHELAHARRWDCATQLMADVVVALHWLNPLAWWAARCQRAESEHACDDLVLARGDLASAYAEDLVRVARSVRPMPRAAAAMARSTGVKDRVLAILTPEMARDAVGRPTVLAGAVFGLAVTASLAVLTPVAAQSPASEGPVVHEVDVAPDLFAEASAASDHMGDTKVASDPLRPDTRVGSDFLPETFAVDPTPLATHRAGLAHSEPIFLTAHLDPTSNAAGSYPSSWPQESCDPEENGTSTNIHSGDDDELKVRIEVGDCRLEVDVEGDVEFTADDTGVARMGPRSFFEIEERIGRTDRRVRMESDRNGDIERRFWIDGDEVAWGPEAERWLAGVLPQLFRRTTLDAERRVRRMLAEGGPERVFQEVDLITSDHVASEYLRLVMVETDLTEAQYVRVLDAALSIESDHAAGELLIGVVESAGLRPAFQTPLLRAAETLDSDHQRTRVLQTVLRSDELTQGQLDAVLQSALSIESDHSMAQILTEVAARGRLDATGRRAFLDAMDSLDSDHSKGNVIEAFLDAGEPSAGELTTIIGLLDNLDSDHTRSTILQRIAADYDLSGEQVTEYLRVARGLESDHSLAVTAEAILEARTLSAEQLEMAMQLAEATESDHSRGSILSTAMADRTLTARQIARLLEVADGLDSDHTRAMVLSELIESQELEADGVMRVLQSAGRTDSDHQRLQIMIALVDHQTLDARALDRYEELARTMSRFQRERALEAIAR